jgi:lysozyme
VNPHCRRRPARAEVDAEVGVFLSAVEAAWGRPLLLYAGDDFEHRYPVRERLGRDLWHRRFLRRPGGARWTVWQLHGYAHVAGIHGGGDLNVMRPAS